MTRGVLKSLTIIVGSLFLLSILSILSSYMTIYMYIGREREREKLWVWCLICILWNLGLNSGLCPYCLSHISSPAHIFLWLLYIPVKLSPLLLYNVLFYWNVFDMNSFLKSFVFFICFHYFLIFLRPNNFSWPVLKFAHYSHCFVWICYGIPMEKFSNELLQFSAWVFLFGSFFIYFIC
jgi:hypothetical protein